MRDFFKVEKLSEIFNYIYWFLCLNVFFLLFNIPLIIFLAFIGIDNILNAFPIFILSIIPLGPTLTVLLYGMGKIIREKHLNLISDLIAGFKLNFKQSLLIWSGELFFIFIIYSNIRFFSHLNNLIITCLFAGLLLLIALVTPFIFILISRFSMKSIDIVKSSLILAITRPILAITNLLVLAVTLIVFEFSPANVALFISSIFTYLLLFVNKALLQELENTKIS